MKYIFAAAMSLMATPSFAQCLKGCGTPHSPEMDAGASVAAIALLVGVAAIIRERSKRK